MNEVLSFLQEVGALLSGDVFNAILVFALTFLMAVVAYSARRFGGTEIGRQILTIWGMVDDVILDVAITVAFSNRYDPIAGQELADAYNERFGTMIDPRLAYVVQAAENEIENHSQIDFDFFMVVNRAERLFQVHVKPRLNNVEPVE